MLDRTKKKISLAIFSYITKMSSKQCKQSFSIQGLFQTELKPWNLRCIHCHQEPKKSLGNSTISVFLDTYRTRPIITFGLYAFYPLFEVHSCTLTFGLRYTYRVLQTIQMKLILLCVVAERAVLDSAKTALKFKYGIKIG